MRDFKKMLLGGAAVVTLAAVAGAPVSAMAQTQPQTANQDDEEDEDEATEVEAITVTGSRIRRNEFNSAAPVTVITSEQATLEGIVDTAELLQQSSVASGSFQTNNTLTGFVTQGGGGASSVSLRGLGANRTLSLINGKRAGPAGVSGTVQAFDLNVLPQSMIQRVEILNDSASSVYGSDAIAGVINYITRTDLDGFQFDAFATVPAEQGGEQYRFSGSWGTTFDRGSFAVGFDYFAQEPLRRGQRDYLDCAQDYVFDQNNPSQMVDLTDPFTGEAKCYGLFAGVLRANAGGGTMDFFYPVAGRTYATPQQGASVWIANMIRQGRGGFPATWAHGNYQFGSNGEGPIDYYGRQTLLGEMDRYTLFSNLNYDLAPNAELYAELLWNRRRSEQDGARQFFPTTSGFIPGAQRPDTGTPFAATTILPIIPLNSDGQQLIDYTRAVVGVRGDFSLGFLRNWGYDIYAQWSRSDGEYSFNALYADRVAAVTGVDPGLTTFTSAAPCYEGPLVTNLSGYSCSMLPGGVNWTSREVLEGRFSDAERAFLMFDTLGSTEYTHQYIEGVFSGDLFELPAGPIAAAVGFQLRREEIDDQPDPQTQAGNLWGFSSAGRTMGEDTVKEFFAEFEVPLIRDVRFIDSLTANISGRYSDYESYGSTNTYKVGINWQINPSWRIRATRGTSFRAPALYELFLANQTGFQGQTAVDPCVQWELDPDQRIQQNCAAAGIPAGYTAAGSSSALIISGGGAGVLEAETGDAHTIGVVWTPSFIDLNVAVDYFDIQISDEITRIGPAAILRQCYRSSAFPTDPLCSLFTRQAGTNFITQINDSYVNVADQQNRGIDMTFRYGHEFGFGDLTIDGQFTWQIQDVTTLFPGSPQQDFNGTTFAYDGPDFTGNLNFRFDRGDWTAFWGVNIIGKGSDYEQAGGAAAAADLGAISRYYRCSNDGGATFVDCPSVTDGTGTLLPGYTVPGANSQVPNWVGLKIHNEFTTTHTVSLRRNFGDWSAQIGVANVFDDLPPNVTTGNFRAGTAALNGYDYIGRRAFFRVSASF
ncbi:TonB-dependent receptor [Brevundimonas sp. 2R-24]|uniref:TonB-dependent receptor n=1 Tax=Peiella sedimenti TaxID=3061083 RepID=A0ABT8SLK8_9CAUL|nr:TonB-dependent receptor [Caulobacteraceae bacterium XZ-24]